MGGRLVSYQLSTNGARRANACLTLIGIGLIGLAAAQMRA